MTDHPHGSDDRLGDLPDDRLHRPYKIALLAESLGAQGVPVAALLEGSGVAPAMLDDPEARVSVRQLLAVLARAATLAPEPGWALRTGTRVRITHLGLYGYALLASPTPRHAIDFALRYRALASPLIGLAFAHAGDEAVWSFSDTLGLRGDAPLLRAVIELQLGTQLALHRDVLGAALAPLRVRLSYPAPPHAALYGELLGCTDVAFDSGADELRFDAAWLERPLAAGNAITAAMVQHTCDQLLAELQAAAAHGTRGGAALAVTSTAARVAGLLLRTPGQFPDIETVAAQMAISSRTLRRRLLAEGRSFQQLLDEVRHQLALDYLRRTRMSNEDIAAALGFSDAANFRHAFKRWSGLSPAAWRSI
ncbi:MAG: AraC family transcriptional regulator [Ideonella sp.]|nr:AraC family transcriptional regulator [Ideonella sp.]MCC7455583.1 AraC family transcriptional regulator [Nitrospira sp.]